MKKNRREGKETSIDRTRRLLYVACSRAQQSLAIIVYTNDPEKIAHHVVKSGWFERNEIVRM